MAKSNPYPEPPVPHGLSRLNGQAEDRKEGSDGREESPSRAHSGVYNPFYTGRPRSPLNTANGTTIDRQEIIRRIKSGGSRPTSPELDRSGSSGRKRRSPTPFSPSEVPSEAQSIGDGDNRDIGMQIERPRSALHRGDFRERDETSQYPRLTATNTEETTALLSTSPVAPWHPHFPSSALRSPFHDFQQSSRPASPPSYLSARPHRTRATSQASLATSFVYKAPTSPLVQSSRPDTPEPGQRRSSRSPDKSRRHTFSPRSFQNFQAALEYPSSARQSVIRQPPSLRSEKTFPYQAHQPRRSLASFTSLPQTPSASRRPSLSESPLHHAPMVGSYEESILRGRMSTTPSKPLNFVAQIGVLGKGNCRANLKCPPHATIPFPAVFYSYGDGRSTLTSDQPSPYVGLVDLENTLANPDAALEKRRQRLQAHLSDEGSRASSRNREEGSTSDAQARRRRRQKVKRRSGSPKAPPGGSYRIPQQGQLQVIIKNPNKTAVKLFLIPYDLSDMEPGQKTFIRQRSYSAGPILDMPLSSRKNYGTDRPEASLSGSDDPNERPMLRYLIHLHICCPAKGRYFLYKSMRVVFANRVPDGKEKLRNEIQLPEPRYSTYKAGRDSNANTMNVAKDHSRRLSHGEPTTPETRRPMLAYSLPAKDHNPHFMSASRLMQPLPFHVNPLPALESRPCSRGPYEGMEVDSDLSNETTSPHSTFSSPPLSRGLEDAFEFQRDPHSDCVSGARSESLLSRRLKDLAFQGLNGSNRNIDGSGSE